ncbi:MAG: hypothetical protein AB7K24_18535, partial [Gemmataceae bacterium]
MLLGGLAFKLVERRSQKRGDSPEMQQAVIHRGLLFGSGIVAGEAIMGILMAIFMVVNNTPEGPRYFDMPLVKALGSEEIELPDGQKTPRYPLLKHWSDGGTDVGLVSLAALVGVTLLLMGRSLYGHTPAPPEVARYENIPEDEGTHES